MSTTNVLHKHLFRNLGRSVEATCACAFREVSGGGCGNFLSFEPLLLGTVELPSWGSQAALHSVHPHQCRF